MPKHEPTIGELQDEIKARDRRLEELREEVDELRELTNQLREHVEEADEITESWCETFDMVLTDDGCWTWAPFWDEHNKTIDDYNELVDDWNKYAVPLLRGIKRNVGRPLAASEADIER